MTDAEIIASMIESLEKGDADPGQPHSIEFEAIGFPDCASAETFAADCERHGLSVSVQQCPLMTDAEWDELLREVGMPADEPAPSREEFRDWHVGARANLLLDRNAIGALWDFLARRAKALGGHLCSVSFPA